MKPKVFPWTGAADTAGQIRIWTEGAIQRPAKEEMVELAPGVGHYEDARLLELTNRFDATEVRRQQVEVEASEAFEALAGLDVEADDGESRRRRL